MAHLDQVLGTGQSGQVSEEDQQEGPAQVIAQLVFLPGKPFDVELGRPRAFNDRHAGLRSGNAPKTGLSSAPTAQIMTRPSAVFHESRSCPKTGAAARVANFPGVTVESRDGEYLTAGKRYTVQDLST
jgi:hypothetical protein